MPCAETSRLSILRLICPRNQGRYTQGKKLQYNDQSLTNGGKFDLDGDWSIANFDHQLHRAGRDCDVSSRNMNLEIEGRNEALKAFFRQNGASAVGDEVASGNHWHLRF